MVIEKEVADLNKLNNCRIIDGSLTISDMSDPKIKNFSFPELTEVTGYLKIQRTRYLLSIGDLFTQLAIVRGISLNGINALEISDNEDLAEIGLKSLRFVGNGNVRIRKNKNLCFADTIDWSVIAPFASENDIEVVSI